MIKKVKVCESSDANGLELFMKHEAEKRQDKGLSVEVQFQYCPGTYTAYKAVLIGREEGYQWTANRP